MPNRRCPPPFDVTKLLFAVYKVQLEEVDLVFWATAEQEDVLLDGAARDESVSEEPLDESDFEDDFGENIRCGNVYEAVTALCSAFLTLRNRGALGVGTHLLELGAGVGLPGLWAAAAGASVVLSDAQKAVLHLLRRNVALNSRGACSPPPQIRELHWGDAPGWLLEAFDMVVAADVLYEEGAAELLFATAAAALRPHGTLLLAHRERQCHLLSTADALQIARRFGFQKNAGEVTCPGVVEVFVFVRIASLPVEPVANIACCLEIMD
jgi:hypothetical protein